MTRFFSCSTRSLSWADKIYRQKRFHQIQESLSTMYYSLEKQDYVDIDEFLTRLESETKNLIQKPIEFLHKTDLKIPDLDHPISVQERDKIQEQTQGQGDLWKKFRQDRLTASIAGMCMKARNIPSKDRLFREIQPNEATKHGKAFEELALDCLSARIKVPIMPSGFWIDLDRPWLGASPDGLVYENDTLVAIVEVKCPFTARFDTIENWSRQKQSCLDSNLELKQTHDYYYQIQMQMAITGTNRGLFAIYTGVDLFHQWIDFDPVLWSEMLVKFEEIRVHLRLA